MKCASIASDYHFLQYLLSYGGACCWRNAV
jgi:hypothetical protein